MTQRSIGGRLHSSRIDSSSPDASSGANIQRDAPVFATPSSPASCVAPNKNRNNPPAPASRRAYPENPLQQRGNITCRLNKQPRGFDDCSLDPCRFSAGLLAAQAAFNVSLAHGSGGPIWAGFFSFVVGTVALALLLAAVGSDRRRLLMPRVTTGNTNGSLRHHWLCP